MKKLNKNWLVLFVLGFVVMLLAACGGSTIPEEAVTEASEEGVEAAEDVDQEIVYAATSDAVGLSPIMTNDSVSSNAISQIYETLFVRNPETMEIEPKLAESYETPDDKTWVIHLKEGITFQDGTPFNAEAVKYTFDKLRDPATAAPRASLLEPVESVNVIDENTVEIKTKYPYGPMLAALSHTNASIVSPTADQAQDLMQQPVGTGPFQFVEWTQGESLVLEDNPDYWGGAPELDKVTFKVVPEISTAISMLQTGEVDFIDGLPSDQIDRIRSLDNVEVLEKPGTPVYYLNFNFSKEMNQDPEFRKAVAAAINRDAFVENLNGLGVRSDSVIGPKVFGYTEEADNGGQAYDPELAKQLVEENGYGDQTIKMLVANRDNYMQMAEIAQAQLAEAGFDVAIETMEWGTFLDATAAGEYDLTFLGWSNVTGDGSELLYPNFHSDNIGASNRSQYSNPEFDELVNASRVTVDQDARKQALIEANQLLLDETATVVMNHGVVTAATADDVQGLKLDPNGQWFLENVTRE
ncbi:glutathione ABC transporter substrate-binding protein [Indiicoccus explosivorum]|uniref:glutathione ABC transporter substrate-binding protein n=1 Tax=Indiicoccus explosivorum TaxID=1917864 RepID=UPI000B4329C8|nr:glutathione ABC transporter substrate-binding protein [Indiicoccus explosivorum]